MSRARTLVYFGHAPQEGAGSAIIVLRHLRRFAADGWNIRIVADWGQDHALCREAGWPVLTLSHRRTWWPPFNANQRVSRSLRARLWAGEARRWLGANRPDAVLTYLSAFSDTLSIAAVGFARRYSLPLATLVHDDARCFTAGAEGERAHQRREWIVQHSTKAWFASSQLAGCFSISGRQSGVLPPIPEGTASVPLNRSQAKPPLLVYAGNYWPAQLPTLARIATATRAAGGRFLAILKENTEHVALLQAAGAEWMPPFARNVEALNFLRENAAALLVSYADTTADMPWTRTSFPSKFIEYCHLGLPIAIVAPQDTAIAEWAVQRNYPDVFDPRDTTKLSAYISQLGNEQFCNNRMAEVRSFATGEFSAERIHRALESSLESADTVSAPIPSSARHPLIS
ncbi:MAG: hypothetical protein V4773_17900 [Verrucomicrobiota bacterium]